MGEITGIEWTDHTFNPWIGCTKVSAACDHCYAETLVKRYGWAEWGAGQPRKRTSEANWKKPLAWDRKAKADGVRRRVFCASLADVFDAEVSDEWRADLFTLIVATPNLDWLLLTKRPQVAKKWWDKSEGIPPNIWLGTTVEDQKMADLRIPILLSIPAKVRFLSCEPLLGPVDLSHWFLGIDWVIAGGESGPGARPMHPQWARSLRDQCAAAGVPFFFKQWGEWLPDGFWENTTKRGIIMRHDGARPTDADLPAMMNGTFDYSGFQHFSYAGKKAAGSLLDGREHKEFPA